MLDVLAQVTTTATPPSGGYEALLIGVVVALANGLVAVVQAFIGSVKKRNAGGTCGPDPRGCIVCQQQVKGVYEVLTRTDSAGSPLIYGHQAICDRMDVLINEVRKNGQNKGG